MAHFESDTSIISISSGEEEEEDNRVHLSAARDFILPLVSYIKSEESDSDGK